MAGSIFISRELRLPVSTQQFDYLTDRIRRGFDLNCQAALRRIYSPMEDGGMNFISIENEDRAGFEEFRRAVLQARSLASTERDYADFEPLWTDLVETMRLDSRFSQEST